MKKRITEAFAPLQPGEEQILRNYGQVSPAVRQELARLRTKNPNANLQMAAQQLLQTPHFQGNKQLTALSTLQNNAVQSSAQVASMFAKNPVKPAVTPPPANILNRTAAPLLNDPQKVQQNQVLAKQHGVSPFADEDEIQQTIRGIPSTSNGQVAAPQGASQQMSLRDKMKQNVRNKQGNANTQRIGEGFGDIAGATATAGGSLQKIFKTVSTLKPEELQLLMKMLTSMLGQGQQTGTSSMSSSSQSINASQKYKADKIMLESIKRKILKETFKQEIIGQVKNHRLVESLLNEGPMGNVWQGIKQAGTGFADKMKQKMGMNLPDSPEDQAKAYSTELIKFIKKANQTRQQFKSQILKNAEIINTYHDAVAAAWETFSNVGGSLGAASGHLQQQVEELVSNLKYDLESEREQIGSFLNVLKNLKGSAPSSDPARQAATAQRDLEASENPPGANSLGKGRRFSSANRTAVPSGPDPIAAQGKAAPPVEQDPKLVMKNLVKQLIKSKDKSEKKALHDQIIAMQNGK